MHATELSGTAPPASGAVPVRTRTHTMADDVQAGITAVVLVSLGLSLLGSAHLVTGGTPGLGFLLSYATGWPLGVALFVVNVPFYVLAWRVMGPRFTFRTLAAVAALSVAVEAVRRMLAIHADAPYAALAGGVLIGVGLLVMFRHGASFGGVNVLALWLYRTFGWSTGKMQLAIDAGILCAAFAVVDGRRVAWSLLGAAAVNAVLIWNHRPGRYSPDPGP
jgi:uncharacterized membrane-anchored protein YitT (DUF2179 family)